MTLNDARHAPVRDGAVTQTGVGALPLPSPDDAGPHELPPGPRAKVAGSIRPFAETNFIAILRYYY